MTTTEDVNGYSWGGKVFLFLTVMMFVKKGTCNVHNSECQKMKLETHTNEERRVWMCSRIWTSAKTNSFLNSVSLKTAIARS